MITLNLAFSILDKIIDACNIPIESEYINVSQSYNRVLAKTQLSYLNLPPFDKSTMDGYAIILNDKNQNIIEYKIIDTIAAGKSTKQILFTGTTIKVMTGSKIPINTGLVVPIEMVELQNDRIRILQWPQNSNFCKCGEEKKKGDLIVTKGSKLDSIAIANIISCGITTVPVYKKIRVSIIATGNEIVDEFYNMNDSSIMNTNGPMLYVLCNENGLEIVNISKIGDVYSDIMQTLQSALSQSDIIIFSGGISVGDYDIVKTVFIDCGLQIHFNSVSLKPGKPITFASSKNKLIFGLPGNPISTFLTFNLFVIRALHRILGITVRNTFNMPLPDNFVRQKADRTECVLCTLAQNGSLIPIMYKNSGYLSSLLQCDGFFIVPQGIKQYNKNEIVNFTILKKLF